MRYSLFISCCLIPANYSLIVIWLIYLCNPKSAFRNPKDKYHLVFRVMKSNTTLFIHISACTMINNIQFG